VKLPSEPHLRSSLKPLSAAALFGRSFASLASHTNKKARLDWLGSVCRRSQLGWHQGWSHLLGSVASCSRLHLPAILPAYSASCWHSHLSKVSPGCLSYAQVHSTAPSCQQYKRKQQKTFELPISTQNALTLKIQRRGAFPSDTHRFPHGAIPSADPTPPRHFALPYLPNLPCPTSAATPAATLSHVLWP
jgi:hypothetical protein